MGANVNRGGTDNELFFNDVDIDTWKPFSWEIDPLSGKRQLMQGTVYRASPTNWQEKTTGHQTTMDSISLTHSPEDENF